MKYLKLLPMFFVLLMIACDKEDESQSSPIDSIILITATETSSTNEIILDCRTKKEYQCSNYKILSTKRIDQNSIELSFEAIDGENICATAFGPATTIVNFGVLAIGEYSLTFKTMGAQNNGRLIVTETQIIFEFDSLNGIDILTPIVQR